LDAFPNINNGLCQSLNPWFRVHKANALIPRPRLLPENLNMELAEIGSKKIYRLAKTGKQSSKDLEKLFVKVEN